MLTDYLRGILVEHLGRNEGGVEDLLHEALREANELRGWRACAREMGGANIVNLKSEIAALTKALSESMKDCEELRRQLKGKA